MGAAVGNQTMELEWNDLTVILAICRAGSLSGAARILGHNHSTIFRKINAIEEKIGVRFFERLPDGYVMTEAGETVWRIGDEFYVVETRDPELSAPFDAGIPARRLLV